MNSLYGALALLIVALSTCVHAQIVGPDAGGTRYFYYANYSGVYLLQGNLKPSITFHPVLGGVDNTYIRYENWATFNFTSVQEKSGTTVVASEDPMTLNWTLVTGSDTHPVTKNFHTFANLSARTRNGAQISVLCETWSLGSSNLYGPYLNNITADETEITLRVTDWPFKDQRNKFHVEMLVQIDNYVSGLPVKSSPTPYQRTVTISSFATGFSVTLMTDGLLDGVAKRFDHDERPYGFSGAYFELISDAFNDTYVYDPNLSVLLKNNPDCSKLSDCSGGHGTCVKDNECKCKKQYLAPDCEKVNPSPSNSTSSDENLDGDRRKTSRLSTVVIIAVSVGAVVVVVVAMVAVFSMYHRRTRGRTHTLARRLEQHEHEHEHEHE